MTSLERSVSSTRFSRRAALALSGSAATLSMVGAFARPGPAGAQATGSVTIGIGEDGYVTDARQRIGFMPFNTNIFETLVRLTPDFRIEPLLAEAWELTETNTWRFQLRDGVTFHNGEPLTSAAVVWTMERVASQGGGVIAMAPGATRALGPLSVEIVYETPNLRLLEQLCAPGIGSIIAPNSDPATSRIGTGPFREVAYVPEDRYVVQANPDYWGDDKASVEQITFRFYPDPATRLLALQAGEIDLNIEVDRQSADVVRGDGSLRLSESPPGGYEVLMMNRNGPAPFDLLADRALRQAVAYAVDQTAIIDAGWLGNATPNTTIMPAAIFGDAAGSIGAIPYDPVIAARLLDEAGWTAGDDGARAKDGRALALTLVNGYPTATEHGSTAELIQAQLADAGIAVEIVTVTDRAAYGDLLDRGEGDLWLEAAGQDDASPTYIFFTFTGDNAWGRAFSPGAAFDALVAEATAARTTEEAQIISAQALQIVLVDDVTVVPLAGFSRLWGSGARIAGDLTPHPSRYAQRWTKLSLAG